MSLPNELLPVGLLGASAGGYEIERSLRFNSADSAYLSRTPASAGNRKTWTWAGWVKRSAPGEMMIFFRYPTTGTGAGLSFSSNDTLGLSEFASSVLTYGIDSTAVFRDYSAWYHIVAVIDSSNATSTERARLYVNGVRITNFGTATYPSLNYEGLVNQAALHTIGRREYAPSYAYFNGYLAEVHFIDGQALDPTSFGEFDRNGIWQPKLYRGTYGTNGFKLNFADNSSNTATTLGKDTSGNGNNWLPNNLSINSGGPTSVSAASGALPIYNTTDTYGTTKGTGTRTDSNSSSIVLAVPMDGANNGTTFTDESATIKGSGSAKTISAFGTAKTSTAQSKFYGSSGYTGSAGNSYLLVSSSVDYAFGTGDFTIEGYFYVVSAGSNNCVMDFRGAGNNYFLRLTSSTNYELLFWSGSQNSLCSFTAPSGAWNHIAISRSGTTLRVFVNGIQTNSISNSSDASSSGPVYISTFGDTTGSASSFGFDGYIQDLRIYKGVAKYTGNFNPPSSTANATIGAGNDSLVDVPTNGTQTDTGLGGEVRGNYCTLNPTDVVGGVGTLSDGNLRIQGSGSGQKGGRGTIGFTSGKFYWEMYIQAAGSVGNQIHLDAGVFSTNLVSPNIFIRQNGSGGSTPASGSYFTFTTGDIVSCAVDNDTGTVTWSKNGASGGPVFNFTAGTEIVPRILTGDTGDVIFNFGQRSFAYQAPSGFKALNTANLPTPTVLDGSDYMDVVTYTGNGSTQTISGLEFSPDLVWIKQRSSTEWHVLTDSVRGNQKTLFSNSTTTEDTTARGVSLQSSGFDLTDWTAVNASAASYAGWCWDAGSTTVTNTNGSITSSVRANPSAGFSIVTYTSNGTNGTSVGHGLNVKPALVIQKNRTSTSDWLVLTQLIDGSDDYLLLNSAAGAATAAAGMTSTTFGSWDRPNGNSMVAYCFAPVAGYSAFGSYTGNGSTDGPFVYLGFRPRFLLWKSSSYSTGDTNWVMFDSARSPYNRTVLHLRADLSAAEASGSEYIDLCSNGFKLRYTDANNNANGQTYVYAAFAENPFSVARAR
jgi:hypothetical protein